MMPTQIDPRDFPDSPYALELQRTPADLRFTPSLEKEYSQVHLRRVRLRVRVWFTFVLIVRVLFVLGQVHREGAWTDGAMAQLCALLPCSAFLTWLAWSASFESIYLGVARFLMPLFCALVAFFAVLAIAAGQFEQFAAFTVALIAASFFAGLKFREAMLTTVCILVSFAVAGVVVGLPTFTLLKCMAVLGVTAVLVSISCRDVEKSSRREFLEHALVAQLLTHDSLSGLKNRRAFDEHLIHVWHHGLRQQSPIAVCMIDVDHFKRYNDAFGHQAGDVALSRIAGLIQPFAR